MRKITLLVLVAMVAFAAVPKSSPGTDLFAGGYEPLGDTQLFFDDFNDGDVSDWTMEGTPDWVVSTNYDYDGGGYGLQYAWGYSQDARAISPEIVIPAGATEIQFGWAWEGSYHWMVDPNDNCTFTVEVCEVGQVWEELWNENDHGTFDNFTWYEELLDLPDTWGGKTVQFSFHAVGNDDADIGVDIPEVTYTAGSAVEEAT